MAEQQNSGASVPPTTHYKDEADDKATMDVVSQELDREAAEKARPSPPPPQPELKTLPVQKGPDRKKPTNAANIVNAFRQKMSTASTTVELPSIGRTVEFKEISVNEQKDLSKVAMENDSRSDMMYCAMVNLINRLSIDRTFDVRDHSEFERIAITLSLQQTNKANPEIRYTCPKCGRENVYRLDTAKMLRQFGKSYRPDRDFEVEAGQRRFTFTVGWASVRNVEDFFKNYYRKWDRASKTTKDSLNQLSQIEYIAMFLKKVTVADVSDPEDSMTADLQELPYPDRVQIVDCLPQGILFDENTGIISKIIAEYVTPMNDCFKYRDCEFCGAEQNGAMANISDFMGY